MRIFLKCKNHSEAKEMFYETWNILSDENLLGDFDAYIYTDVDNQIYVIIKDKNSNAKLDVKVVKRLFSL